MNPSNAPEQEVQPEQPDPNALEQEAPAEEEVAAEGGADDAPGEPEQEPAAEQVVPPEQRMARIEEMVAEIHKRPMPAPPPQPSQPQQNDDTYGDPDLRNIKAKFMQSQQASAKLAEQMDSDDFEALPPSKRRAVEAQYNFHVSRAQQMYADFWDKQPVVAERVVRSANSNAAYQETAGFAQFLIHHNPALKGREAEIYKFTVDNGGPSNITPYFADAASLAAGVLKALGGAKKTTAAVVKKTQTKQPPAPIAGGGLGSQSRGIERPTAQPNGSKLTAQESKVLEGAFIDPNDKRYTVSQLRAIAAELKEPARAK